jgi:predicted phosphodiesterase
MNSHPLLFAGDPHGDFRPVLLACSGYAEPGTVVIVGDLELTQPLLETLRPAVAAGWEILWILGNHDTDSVGQYLFLASKTQGYPEGFIGNRVVRVPGGPRVAGLSGVFKGKIWRPPEEPLYCTRDGWLRKHRERFLGGLPLHMRDTIWPEDVELLARQRADVLVCHEGPSSVHRGMGFSAIDDLAAKMGVRMIVHGHHHHSAESVLPNGVRVRSLAIGEVWRYEL